MLSQRRHFRVPACSDTPVDRNGCRREAARVRRRAVNAESRARIQAPTLKAIALLIRKLVPADPLEGIAPRARDAYGTGLVRRAVIIDRGRDFRTNLLSASNDLPE